MVSGREKCCDTSLEIMDDDGCYGSVCLPPTLLGTGSLAVRVAIWSGLCLTSSAARLQAPLPREGQVEAMHLVTSELMHWWMLGWSLLVSIDGHLWLSMVHYISLLDIKRSYEWITTGLLWQLVHYWLSMIYDDNQSLQMVDRHWFRHGPPWAGKAPTVPEIITAPRFVELAGQSSHRGIPPDYSNSHQFPIITYNSS